MKVWIDGNAVLLTGRMIARVLQRGEISSIPNAELQILTSITHHYSIPQAFPASSNQSNWMQKVWIGGTAVWLAAAAALPYL